MHLCQLQKLIFRSLQQKRGTVMTHRYCSNCLPTIVAGTAERLLFDSCMVTPTPKLMLDGECIMSRICLVLMAPCILWYRILNVLLFIMT